MTDTTTNTLPFANKPQMRVEMRCWCDLARLWRLCAKPACQRGRACKGDARRCLSRQFHLLPEGVRAWFDGLSELRKEGLPFDDAMEELDATECGDALRDWFKAVAKSLGDVDATPYRWWDVK